MANKKDDKVVGATIGGAAGGLVGALFEELARALDDARRQ